MRSITLHHQYPQPPKRVWQLVTDFEALEMVMQGLIAFKELPKGRIYEGQHLDVEVSLFGKLPWQPYSMTVVVCDDERMNFQSSEVGAGVKTWRHSLTVTDTETGGSCLTETIEIDAGLLTRPFLMWARYLYNARHQPRERLLASENF
ncbi:SRPBCC family protein [Aliiroseovarius sp. 2305UL8-7]|uniref:SRPBCC family protein n=1 Tax=Aliiroseovarius conchicola TaxID=3121637 RepID=UPI003529659E